MSKPFIRYTSACALTAALMMSSASGVALEVTAGGGSGAGDANIMGTSNKVDAMQAALLAGMNLILACNNKGMIYASNPAIAGRDADGCVGVTFKPADYEIVKDQVVEAHPSVQCNGRGCTASLSMARYVGKDNITIQARCEGAWCANTGSAILPDLNSNWTGRVTNRSGSKRNGIDATYSAATRMVTFKTWYEGDSSNNKNANLRDVVIKYTDLVIQEKKPL